MAPIVDAGNQVIYLFAVTADVDGLVAGPDTKPGEVPMLYGA
jgi:hypothetical protein